MKKTIIVIVSGLIFGAIAVALILNFSTKSETKEDIIKSNSKEETTKTNSNSTQNQETKQNEVYEIKISTKEITIEKGSTTSFEVTFTNPDEASIMEYIKCDKQNEIIDVKYSQLKDKKITVELKALKVGSAEITISDYNYPNKKEIVKVNVVEKK